MSVKRFNRATTQSQNSPFAPIKFVEIVTIVYIEILNPRRHCSHIFSFLPRSHLRSRIYLSRRKMFNPFEWQKTRFWKISSATIFEKIYMYIYIPDNKMVSRYSSCSLSIYIYIYRFFFCIKVVQVSALEPIAEKEREKCREIRVCASCFFFFFFFS